MSAPARVDPASDDGRVPPQQAVAAARAKLAEDLELLDREVRSEVAYTVEKTAWKVLTGLAAFAATVVVRKVLESLWGRLTKADAPTNPADPSVGWREALLWTAATGVGIGIGRTLAQRGAASAWTKATGRMPPPFEEELRELPAHELDASARTARAARTRTRSP